MKNSLNNKIVAILGPTSSGKSGLAIQLAKQFGGEILSADSRQIYRKMDVGTGKIEADQSAEIPQKVTSSKFYAGSRKSKPFISEGIPHYGINIVSPKTEYNVAKFKKYAHKVIADILERGKLPIICGGTGFWIKAVINNVAYPEVKPDCKLREKLREKTAQELFQMLEKLDPARAKTIDKNNPARLIRAIEICKKLGQVPSVRFEIPDTRYKTLQIGIAVSKEKLHKNIKKRLRERFEANMIEEVKKLHFKDKISWKRLESFGLGYKLIPQYLRGTIKTEDELFEKIFQVEKDYAKRQMTWFQKDKRIVWLEKYKDIENSVADFIFPGI